MPVVQEVGAGPLGRQIAELRESTGLKQSELAQQVTWSQPMLSRVEAGERLLSDDELATLLAAIGTPDAVRLNEILQRQWQHLARPSLGHPDEQLLWEAELVAVELAALLDGEIRPPFARRIREYLSEIRRVVGLLARREHQIAFVGSIGVGKSTAICRAAKLEIPRDGQRPDAVLDTGAGGVTLCEVTLRTGPGYALMIEPQSQEEIDAYVADFADQLRRPFEQSEASERDEAAKAVPREVERAIRNMAGLQKKKRQDESGKTYWQDPAKELAESLTSRDLRVEILTRMTLHRRDRREAQYDSSTAGEPLAWLKSIFAEVNNGRHPEFSLPARIDLVVRELIPVPDLDVTIVDTRGIDQPTGRADLEQHLEDPHTVTVLCSRFNDAPEQSLHHLLKRALEIVNRQIDSHCSILVVPRPEEAMAVKDDSGLPVETSEDGYELKAEQVQGALAPYQLDALPVAFFNAQEDDAGVFRTSLAARVLHTRAAFRRQLDEVLGDARSLLANAEREAVLEEQRAATRHLLGWVTQHEERPEIKGHVHDTLLGEIAAAHASTIHAAVRRDGEWQSLSYSHQLGHGARRLAAAALRDRIVGFRDLCETFSGTLPEAAELLSQASRLMLQSYDDLLRKMQVAGGTLYREQFQQSPEFWKQCADEWGRGGGYRDRVGNLNTKWFRDEDRRHLEEEMLAMLDREWMALLDRVKLILEVS